ncbi:MAG: nucleotidyltransferase domain-containing protein [Prevotellaceae bacterium]|nr:nucleotidyltransferase domain-containing protein [Prevotellaceae bacterium]
MEKLHSVFIRFPGVEEVVLYGSRAKGNCQNGSDIDITMKGEHLDGDMSSKILLALDDLLLPYMIDLSIFRQIDNLDLINHINRVGQLLYKK